MEDIKKKYLELALLHHPDRNEGRESKFFLKIQEAYLILSNSNSRLKYDMFMNISNPNFDAAEARKNLRYKFMTPQERREHEAKKSKLDDMLKRIQKEQKETRERQALNEKIERDIAAKRSEQMILKARQELIRQAEEMRQWEIKFRERLRKEHIEMLKSNENMVKGMMARDVDLTNFDTYVKEFYDKNNNLYIKDYESKMQSLEKINKIREEKLKEYAGFQGMNKERRVKFNNNQSKIDAYSGIRGSENGQVNFKKVSGAGSSSQQSMAGPIAITIGVVAILAGGAMING
ncbi:unnamed protein product [Moneuplotes crassus]|uniref:J domain-containing protein n=1 Tax=Euplotes crassus TaxID=5936 RepID=A0AAD1X9U1_EUPCR|nr:unnamed protein product [Moneuplotes crassus]